MPTRRAFVVKVLPAAASALVLAGCVGVPGVPGISDVDTLLREGEQLYREKRYDEAIAKFKMVIVRDPYNWRAWLWLCRTYIVRLMWGDAVEAGRQAFKLSPQGAEVLPTFLQALFGGGLAALNNGNFRESITHFGEYLKLDSGNGGAWLNVGKAYLGNKQYGEALKSLLQALGLKDVNRSEVVSSILSGGMQAFKERDYTSSILMLREYVNQDPRHLNAYLTLAKSYWETGQRGGALSAFTEALRISPANGEALQYMLKLR